MESFCSVAEPPFKSFCCWKRLWDMISNDYEKIFKDRGILCGGCVCCATLYAELYTHFGCFLLMIYWRTDAWMVSPLITFYLLLLLVQKFRTTCCKHFFIVSRFFKETTKPTSRRLRFPLLSSPLPQQRTYAY